MLKVTQVPLSKPIPWLSNSLIKWMLIEDFVCHGITVPKGYVFNGSSIPRLFWWLYPPSYTPAWEASCIHDYCYSHHYPYISKKEADLLFLEIMKQNGASKFSRYLFYTGVRANIYGGGWRTL